MNKPWYTIHCKTREEFMKSYNLDYVHQLYWFLVQRLKLGTNPNHVFSMKEILLNEINDWYGENEEIK